MKTTLGSAILGPGMVAEYHQQAIKSNADLGATFTAAPSFSHRLEFYGTKGSIQVEGDGVGRWQLIAPTQAVVTPPQTGAASSAETGSNPRGIPKTSHAAIFTDFIRAVQQDDMPLINGSEGRRSLAAVLAIYKAAGLLSN